MTVTGNSLDIKQPTAAALRTELTKSLAAINRGVAGFEDFSPNGTAAIQSGDPARSLLYHALASPNVYPSPTSARTDADFPTLVELDTIENYIYSVAKMKLKDICMYSLTR